MIRDTLLKKLGVASDNHIEASKASAHLSDKPLPKRLHNIKPNSQTKVRIVRFDRTTIITEIVSTGESLLNGTDVCRM